MDKLNYENQGKNFSLLGLLSISFSATGAHCPSLDNINKNLDFFREGFAIDPEIGPVTIEFSDPRTFTLFYHQFIEATILIDTSFNCTYSGITTNSTVNIINIKSMNQGWKPLGLWLQNKCKTSPLDCVATKQ